MQQRILGKVRLDVAHKYRRLSLSLGSLLCKALFVHAVGAAHLTAGNGIRFGTQRRSHRHGKHDKAYSGNEN